MSLTVQALALEQYLQLSSDIQLVVVNPRYRQHRYLLNNLLRHDRVLYVRSNADKRMTRTELMNEVDTAVIEQGYSDLSEVYLILLDEFDRVKPKEVEAFLKALMERLDQQRVVFFGRTIPKVVLTKKGLQSVSRIIPHAPDAMLWDYTRFTPRDSLLEVHAFGAGEVILNGKTIVDWDGFLPRALFFYLIDRGMVTRADIFETFWPTLEKREATNVFHVTKRKINEVLGMDLTVYSGGYYQISSDVNLQYDVVNFSQWLQNAEVADTDEALVLYKKALALAKSDYLVGEKAAWVIDRRQELRHSLSDLLAGLAGISERAKRLNEALNYFLRAATMSDDPDVIYESIDRITILLRQQDSSQISAD